MQWGIYNEIYGTPCWAITDEGQIWVATTLSGWKEIELSSRDRLASPDPPTSNVIKEDQWLTLSNAVILLRDSFRFAVSCARELNPCEFVEWSAVGRNFGNKWLATTVLGNYKPHDLFGPCLSPGFHRSGSSTAADFIRDGLDACTDYALDLSDLFARDGRRVDRQMVTTLMEDAPLL